MFSPTAGLEDAEDVTGASALRPRPAKRLGDGALNLTDRVVIWIEDPLGYCF